MEILLVVISLITLIYLLYSGIEFIIGFNTIKNLAREKILLRPDLPFVSIIFGALNEEGDLSRALQSLLNQNYPHFEIIAINDRSTDKTSDILDQFKDHPNMTVVHNQHLPEGWFGKNHALHLGAQKAKGEWLLFTDADVVMAPDALLRTVHYALKQQIDHLTIFERHVHSQFWLTIGLLGYYLSYCMVLKPWRIRYHWSKKSLGHGAFNLVKKSSYDKCGGHEAIAMECLDDLKLGKLIKSHGFKQDTVDGRDYIERNWYASLGMMIDGSKKNSFAFFEYRLGHALIAMVLAMVFYFLPLVGVFIFSGELRYYSLLNIILTFLLAAYVTNHFRIKRLYAFFYPLAIAMTIYNVIQSILVTYKNKGVIWRGTCYSLEIIKNKTMIKLKSKNKVKI